MKHQQCVNCIFSNWYPNFKDVTFRSQIIKLCPEFVTYLKSDGIVLPDNEEIKYSNDLEGYSDSDDDNGWDEVEPVHQTSMFPDLKVLVENTIKEMDGNVFPKLNWSSPRDACWISHNGSLKCSTLNEICLLLKSSDFITHDLNNAFEHCDEPITSCPDDQFELVLREWKEIRRGMEFRCFVKQHKLIRISQRHHGYYPYLQEKKKCIFDKISNFYNSKIKERFCDCDYVFDIYIDGNVIYLVDFNPWGPVTDAILFAWQDLLQLDPQNINTSNEDILVIVTEDNGIQPSDLMAYAMPKDMVDLSRGEDVNKMLDILNLRDLVCRPGESDDDDDDDNN